MQQILTRIETRIKLLLNDYNLKWNLEKDRCTFAMEYKTGEYSKWLMMWARTGGGFHHQVQTILSLKLVKLENKIDF